MIIQLISLASMNWLNPKIIMCVLPKGLRMVFIVGDVGQMVVWVMVELITNLALLGCDLCIW